MSHIPEDELHAYLDQALGRPRCVEIESHLADCTRCREARDGIAALRDRTTAMLARLAPRFTVVPPYADIRRRAQLRIFRQQRVAARLAWAASVVLALGIGWTARTLYRTGPADAPLAAAPAVQPSAATQPELIPPRRPAEPPSPAETQPAPPAAAARAAPTVAARPPEPRLAAAPVTSQPARQQSVPDRWRTVAWNPVTGRPIDTLTADSGSEPPAVSTGSVVTRQLASGEVVRAVGGNPTDVSSLLSGRPVPPAESKMTAAAMPPAYGSGALAIRRGGVAVGPSAVSNDSVRAMMRRLNLMLRVR
jgi:hypothetical protein